MEQIPKFKQDTREVLSHTLKQVVRRSAEAHFLHRLHCVQLVAQGHSAHVVARWFNDDPSSVARWVRQFKREGIQGLMDQQKTGRPARLNPAQRYSLSKELLQPPEALGYHNSSNWNGKLLASHLERHYGMHLSVRQCQRLMRQLRQNAAKL